MHAHANIFAQDRQIFPKIELIAQFVHRSMAFVDSFHRSGGKQPFRKSVLSHAGAGGRQKLKQAAVAEQVEIGGVYVVRIVEALAGFSRVGPTVFDAGQPFFIKLRGPLG